jgi:putative transposase
MALLAHHYIIKPKHIANQEKHHQKFSFRDESLMFLKEYGIDFNEEYL